MSFACETNTSPFLSSIFSNKTGMVSPVLILSERPLVLSSLISRAGSDLSPSTNKNTNFSVILFILPSMILPSSILIFDSWLFKVFQILVMLV